MTKLKFTTLLLGTGVLMGAGTAQADGLLFWSTQASPVEETQRMRDDVVAGYGAPVDYQASDPAPWLTRIQAEIQAGSGMIELLGALHGDFTSVEDGLADVPSDLAAAGVVPGYVELGKLGGETQKYVPWMQATYMMAANRQALDYLPEGTDLNDLTYDQLIAWCKVIAEGEGA
ncbi:MAG: hypothetical protein ACK5LJ_17145 [Paracoccus sp. (in: a-proteobacteria)]